MRQSFGDLTIATTGRGFYEITDQVAAWLSGQGFRTGLATIHIQHTSASLLIQENADPDVRKDFEAFFRRLVPDGDDLFVHTAEGPDDMPAHIRSALTQTNLSIPVRNGKMVLGTWQGVYLWEHRRASHHRRLVMHFIGE